MKFPKSLLVSVGAALALTTLGSCERVEGCEYTGTCPEPLGGAGGEAIGENGAAGVASGGESDGSDDAGAGGGGPEGASGAGGWDGAAAGEAGVAGAPSACPSPCVLPTPACDEERATCVQCLEDAQCSADTPACDMDRGACVECLDDAHCPSAAPACDVNTTTCVECQADDDCPESRPACDMGRQRCVACISDEHCGGTTPFCDSAAQNCVECLQNEDCTDAEAARCSNGTCSACSTKSHCRHIEGANVCDDETCVECTVVDETACGANSCDPATARCTTTPRGSVGLCQRCVADSECSGGDRAVPDTRCVPLEFERSALPGGYCLRRFSAASACPRPFSQMAQQVESLSGAAQEHYCGLDTQVTRCEAVLDLVNAARCPNGEDSACGCPRDAAGNCTGSGTGGLCRTVDGVANSCTYACGTVSDCPSGKSCSIDSPFCY